VLRVLTFIAFLERADRATDRQAAEHIVDGRDQALWGMTSAWMLQAALRIEGLPQGRGSGQSIFGPIEGKDRQTVPKIPTIRSKAKLLIHGMKSLCYGDPAAFNSEAFGNQEDHHGLPLACGDNIQTDCVGS
jgi:hypothetical protein